LLLEIQMLEEMRFQVTQGRNQLETGDTGGIGWDPIGRLHDAFGNAVHDQVIAFKSVDHRAEGRIGPTDHWEDCGIFQAMMLVHKAAVVHTPEFELPEWTGAFQVVDLGDDGCRIKTVPGGPGEASDREQIPAEQGVDIEEFPKHSLSALLGHGWIRKGQDAVQSNVASVVLCMRIDIP